MNFQTHVVVLVRTSFLSRFVSLLPVGRGIGEVLGSEAILISLEPRRTLRKALFRNLWVVPGSGYERTIGEETYAMDRTGWSG
jgi:hypothetical protein